jgi:hypothetical protein
MDPAAVQLLREMLDGDPFLRRTLDFADTLNGSVRTPGGLLLAGTPTEDPWHLAAHLDDESRYAGVPALAPTLVRWNPPPDAPAHLSIGWERIEHARRGETVFVVAPDRSPDGLLERVDDARRLGATVLALGTQEDELTSMAHEALVLGDGGSVAADALTFDSAQHLVSMAAGEAATLRGRRRFRTRLSRMLDTGAPRTRW